MPPGATATASGGVAFDGSAKTDRLNMWTPPLRSADADLLPEKNRIDARALDRFRNDSYLAGGAALRKDNIVGALYRLSAKPETKILFGKDDSVWETEFQEEVETKFTLWAESPQNWIDAARRCTFTDFIRLAVGIHLGAGEVLMSAEWKADGRPYSSCVQMIDPLRLSTPNATYGTNRTRRIRNGVEIDASGAPVAYHIRQGLPGDYFPFDAGGMQKTMTWKRVPVRTGWGRQMIGHFYESMRADQSRGYSMIASGLSEMKMLQHFRMTELQQAVVAATYAASIEAEFPQDVAATMGAVDGESPHVRFAEDYLGMVSEYVSAGRNITMDGVKIPVFPVGASLKIQNPGNTAPNGVEFERRLLRYIAASLGVSYEQLSRDYTSTNYSSARASIGEMRRTMAAEKRMLADKVANFIYRLWLEEAINYNDLETLKRAKVPSFYDRLNAEAYSGAEWVGAGYGQIDPLKETQAALLRIKAGLSTKEYEIALINGGDFRRTARQIQRERDLDAFYGNPSIYDSTGTSDMENSLTATPQTQEGATE